MTAERTTARVRPATAEDLDAIGDMLARAFHDDPATAWILPDSRTRRRQARPLFAANTRIVMDKGEVWTTDGTTGAALWSAPGRWRDRPRHLLRWIPAFLPAWRSAPRALRVMRLMDRHHPSEPHWYLDALAVEPDRQGRGVGSALLPPVLRRCDEQGVPAYLVSSNPRNIPLYERHGFRVTGELPIPGGPVLYPMWRDPQARAGSDRPRR